jgi:quinol-cytochrome oxidoreductase complex cytochrome b subunit
MSEQKDSHLARRIWRSVFPAPLIPVDDRERRRAVVETLLLHIHPPTVPARALRFTNTWGLGGMGLVLLVLLAGTGAMLMLAYRPNPAEAYTSVRVLIREPGFGPFVRNIHAWSANLLLVVAFLHLLRVFFTSAFHGPRQFNWVIGLLLLCCAMAANFTGYLLPWDQLSYWAITIVTGMLAYVPLAGPWLQELARGGEELGAVALNNFYTLHTTIIPVLFLLLLPWHFFRVRKAGGVVLPHRHDEELPEPQERVNTLPDLVVRELTVALVLVAALAMFALLVNAPLGGQANPGMSPNPTKAPWYFQGFQELLLHFHPVFAVCVLPIAGLLFFVLVPYLVYDSDPSGVPFVSPKGKEITRFTALTALAAVPALVLFDELSGASARLAAWLPPLIGNGLIPFLMLAGLLFGFRYTVRRRYSPSRNEWVLAFVVLLLTSFLLLTLISVLFRGPGMALSWPS